MLLFVSSRQSFSAFCEVNVIDFSLCLLQASYPTWEDFVTKGAKLQSQLR